MAVYTDVSVEDLETFLADYDLGKLLSYKGIAEGVENSNFLLHTDAGYFILTLYEKRVAAADLPFFLGLMEHLAARGINCPQPVQGQRRQHAGPSLRPAGGDRDLSRRHVDAARRRRSIAPRSARRWRGCISPAPISKAGAPTRCRSAAGGRLFESSIDRVDHVQHGMAVDHPRRTGGAGSDLAAASAARRDPRRSVSRQCFLSRRKTFRADRLLFRLQRHAGL